MAKVKIQGHASGTGVFTLTSPNSNTDRTITLPDADVTLGTDATKLPLAGGAMTGTTTHADNVKSTWGSGNDFQIYHDGTSNILGSPSGGTGRPIEIQVAGGEKAIKIINEGAVELYHDNNKKFETTAAGVTVGATSVADPVLLIQSSGSGDAQLNFSSAAANRSGTIRFLDNGSAVGGFINYLHNGDKMEFGSGSSTTVGFRVADGYSNAAQGLTFGSDTADANKLDDYEEGTWTPNLGGNTSYNTQVGKYTKVGNMVTLTLEINVNALGTGSTSAIYGAPFTPIAGSHAASGAIGYAANLAVNIISLTFRMDGGNSGIHNAVLTSAANTTASSAAIFGNSARVLFSITYISA